jgi:ABC-2 type transport system permease protein
MKERSDSALLHPFWVIVSKEVSDHVKSWRFIILIAIITLTCLGSIYTAVSNMKDAIKPSDPEGSFLFLKLFTISDETLPPFFAFIAFLGPLLGIALGFDAINSEHNRGTLSRILSQPIHRDYILNAKFVAALFVVGVMLFALIFLVIGLGIIIIGIPPTPPEFIRILIFLLISIVYVAFWLNLSILFSVRFRQPATSALAGIAVWLFFTVFYVLLVKLAMHIFLPEKTGFNVDHYEILKMNFLRVLPNQLYSEATTTLLMPSVKSLSPLYVEKVAETLPGPLPVSQSILLVWPHITGLITGSILCFVLSYLSFMRREIRAH